MLISCYGNVVDLNRRGDRPEWEDEILSDGRCSLTLSDKFVLGGQDSIFDIDFHSWWLLSVVLGFRCVWLQLALTLPDEIVVGDKTLISVVVFHSRRLVYMVCHGVWLQLADSLRWNCIGRQEKEMVHQYFSFKWVEHSQAIAAVTAEGGGRLLISW